ncbi:TPA: ead/Ea22-like family protein [Escherichia coli]|nr:ead/Ea22-like family protein [Escherichia coli]
MSNIDKQALREIAAAAVGAHERLSVMPPDDIFDISLAEGTQLDADITALNALNSAANPTTVLALLASLEAAEKRIAELEAREILLPERSSMLHRTDFHDDYQTVMAYKVSEVIDAIRATGIRIKGE